MEKSKSAEFCVFNRRFNGATTHNTHLTYLNLSANICWTVWNKLCLSNDKFLITEGNTLHDETDSSCGKEGVNNGMSILFKVKSIIFLFLREETASYVHNP